MKLLKDPRFIIWISLVLISLLLLIYPSFSKKSGVVVTFVSDNFTCSNIISEGDNIIEISGQPIKNSDDFYSILNNVNGPTTFIINNNPKTCDISENSNLNITVKNIESKNLEFGIDIEGGTRILLKVENSTKETRDQVLRIIETRINLYGLKEMRISPVGNDLIQVETSSSNAEEVKEFLVKQGKFEAKIQEIILLNNSIGEFKLDDKQHKIEIKNNKIYVDGSSYEDNFEIDGIRFEIKNYTDENIILFADVFTGDDIANVFTDQQHSRLSYVGNMYQFMFTVQISRDGAQKFAKITKGQEIVISQNGESHLKTPLVLFLDEKEVSSLSISSDLAGEEILTPSITGTRETKEDAIKEMNRMESILQSGSLPAKPEIVKMDTISPFLGRDFIHSTLYVILVSCIVVCLIVFVRYRNFKIVFPMIAATLSEIVLILGIASSQLFGALVLITAISLIIVKGEANKWLRWVTIFLMFVMGFAVVLSKWVLDIPAFAGLIAIIGTSIGQMIIITDQVIFGNKEYSFNKKYNKALDMIWNSAATVVAAMFPLIFLGTGMLKGFAITIVIGVTVGIMITRPAYAAILEKLEK